MRIPSVTLFLVLGGCPYIGEKEWVEQIQDGDGDGFVSEVFGGPDCKDDDPAIGDCDSDDDGVRTVRAGGEDCDDDDASVFPGALEVCDGVDQDCDGLADEIEDVESPPTWAADDDGDGFGDPDETVAACSPPSGYVDLALARDCDDGDPAVNPSAAEFCDELDWNCDGDPIGNAVDRVAWYRDADGDGFAPSDATLVDRACVAPPGAAELPATPGEADCDDSDADAFPGALDAWYDGLDSDCAGNDDFDADGDGARLVVDCDDGSAAVLPGAPERCDGVDNDCDTLVDDDDDSVDDPVNRVDRYVDGDGDGFGDPLTATAFCITTAPVGYVSRGDDCNDAFSSAFPGGTELCDGIDNDCNGVADDNAADRVPRWQDADGDGFGDADTPVLACSGTPNTVPNDDDCDDADSATWPGALELCGDNVRQDCSTLSPFDCDGDGFDAVADGGTDCDDGDDDVNPAAREICDGVDNDCDTRFDDQDPNVDLSTIADWFVDADGDGFGDPARLTIAQACAPRPGEAPNGLDCDDEEAAANPESREACDGFDNDCDGLVDDADSDRPIDPPTYWLDLDGDTFGDPTRPSATTCAAPGPEWVPDDQDCQPGLAAINPFALEICDGLDNDCDGLTDDADPAAALTQWFADLDGDGFGQSTDAVAACSQPAGRVGVGGDCDDFDDTRNPGASEVCDAGFDNDCDGLADDADPDLAGLVTWWPDLDGDGYGDAAATPISQCGDIPGYVNNPLDCDDLSATASPASLELCNGRDDDCDTLVDDSDDSLANAPLWYADRDVDGWGSDTDTLRSCAPPPSYRPSSGDCDDADDAVFPNADEVCNGADDDCDGNTDDADPDVLADLYFSDVDGDGYGTVVVGAGCGPAPLGETELGGDCDDGDDLVNPGAAEVCGGVDDDCDGLVDDADGSVTVASSVYRDADGDGFGDAADTLARCAAPLGYVAVAGDCAVADPAVSPAALEACNGADDDCDGTADDAPVIGPITYEDGDGDGFGDVASALVECVPTPGRTFLGGDCDDGTPAARPFGGEDCDGIDNDCDGLVDDADPDTSGLVWYDDVDGDGVGGLVPVGFGCSTLPSWTDVTGDCDDLDFFNAPGRIEECDNQDNDCDGLVDDGDTDVLTPLVYADLDGDGVGQKLLGAICFPGANTATSDGDCDDGDDQIGPFAPESCDGVDSNCDGKSDFETFAGFGGPDRAYADADGDGAFDAVGVEGCGFGPGVQPFPGTDCDDGLPAVRPGAPEVCDTIDNDCDGLADDADPNRTGGTLTALRDEDGDGRGDDARQGTVCALPAPGWVGLGLGGDCDDRNPNATPGKPEACNGFDDDCDGLVDDADLVPTAPTGRTLFRVDGDRDGVGGGVQLEACAQTDGLVPLAAGGDCDDTRSSVRPGAAELCDTIDNDCDGFADDLDANSPRVGASFHDDADNDGFGFGDPKWCSGGAGRSANADDCADADARLYPGQAVTVPSVLPPLSTVQQAIGAVCDDADITVLLSTETTTIDAGGKTVRLHGPSGGRRGLVRSASNPIVLIDDPGVTIEDLDFEATGSNRVLQVVGVTTELSRLSLRDGTASDGGGLQSLNGQVVAVDVEFLRNTATGSGGGASISGGLFVCLGCTFDGNNASTAGALRLFGGAIGWIADSTFRNDVGPFAVDLQSGSATMPYTFEDNTFEHEDGLRVSDASAELRGLTFLDGGNIDLRAFGTQSILFVDSDLIGSGAFGSATMVLDGNGTIRVEGNRFLRSLGGDLSTTSSTHEIVNNTFVDPVDTMIHIVSGTPVIRSNTFFSLGANTVNASGSGAGVSFNVFNVPVPIGVSPIDNPELQTGILFQTWHPNLPPWLWDLHLPFSAAQIDLGDPAGGGLLDPNGADAGAYGGATFYDPYYVDLDADGMGDNWELRWFGTTLMMQDSDDDRDGLSLLSEFQWGTSPVDPDTDDDGCDDPWDFDPLDPLLCGE
jgi:hypothetical protein